MKFFDIIPGLDEGRRYKRPAKKSSQGHGNWPARKFLCLQQGFPATMERVQIGDEVGDRVVKIWRSIPYGWLLVDDWFEVTQ